MNEETENKNFAGQKKSKGGLVRLWNAFTYSMSGLRAAVKYEHAVRQELIAFVPLTILVVFLPLGIYEKVAMILSLFFIFTMEMVNSAIETCVDDISLECRPLAKRAKDIGSAIVFCAMLISFVIWATIIYVNFIA
ncbi:MAG: diacylglycerol kinase [Opitutales bacterium]|nr:diacylglycerol kinase [Opitutales bacterium]